MISSHVSAQSRPVVYILSINEAIGPATVDYIDRGITTAEKQRASLIVLQLDTPGGLEKSMRLIVSRILHSQVPTATFVAPSGARAASAGTFIVYASQIAAMAPGTNIGAATPVSLGPGKENERLDPEEIKAKNDASAYIRSLAQIRNRNSLWGQEAVNKGLSLSANEALALNVINVIADDIDQLLAKINGKKIEISGRQGTLNLVNAQKITIFPDWRTRFLALITDPNIAYILLLVGFYGLLFEFINPGLVLPGVTGLIALLLAFYAFQLLPTHYAGVALLVVGMMFMIAEVFLPSFGALGLGGLIAFIIGSILLFDRTTPGFTLLLPVIFSVAVVTFGYLVLIVQLAIRSRKKPVVSGREELIGSEGSVHFLNGESHHPYIKIRGEIWQVQSDTVLQLGQAVKVIQLKGLTLVVVPINQEKKL